MLPEISHRCPSCGASVRDFDERVMFCPECGKNLTETSSEKPLQEDSQVVTKSAAKSDADEPVVVPPEEVATVNAAVTEGGVVKQTVVEDRHTTRERTRETLH